MQIQYNYEIDFNKMIGKGSFGEVFACKRINNEDKSVQEICVKIINIMVQSDINKKAFFREQEISDLLSKLKNPNIIEIYDVISVTLTKSIKLMIYMEMCDSQDLHQEIQTKKDFTIGEAIHIISQIITGYHTLYYNSIVHRDLKPKNILKSKNGVFKITDFGLSRVIQKAPDQQMFLTSVGTPFYVSPQILDQQNYTSKTDVFSLGIILYQLLHQGKYPINPSTFAEFLNRYKQLQQNRIQIRLSKADPKKNELERLLNQMLIFEENDRISWPELFEHPFFKTYLHKTLNSGLLIPKQKKGVGQNQQDLQQFFQEQKITIEGEYKPTFTFLQILLTFYFQALKLLEKFRTPKLKELLIQIESEDYYNLITSLIGYKYCVLASCYSLFTHQTLVNLSQYDQKVCQKLTIQKIKSFSRLKDLNILNEKIFNEFTQEVEIEFKNIHKTAKTKNQSLQRLLDSSKNTEEIHAKGSRIGINQKIVTKFA
ncbi:hypothetical protein pb186bvf_010616 [Paramecium bursaria]